MNRNDHVVVGAHAVVAVAAVIVVGGAEAEAEADAAVLVVLVVVAAVAAVVIDEVVAVVVVDKTLVDVGVEADHPSPRDSYHDFACQTYHQSKPSFAVAVDAVVVGDTPRVADSTFPVVDRRVLGLAPVLARVPALVPVPVLALVLVQVLVQDLE